jgi:hypothetical protein
MSLYVIATVNTAPFVAPKRDAEPDRAKKRLFAPPAWFRPFKPTPVASREALT